MRETILEANDLSYTYPDGNEAIQGIDLRIEKCSKIFFHGANGAGKTTLFQCLSGLLKAGRGTIRIHRDIVMKERERMKRIGIVFQNASDQIIAGNVFDEVAFGPLHRGLSLETVRDRVEYALHMMGIEHLRNRPPHFLSYGEKKRVAIASVLSMDQEIVILDEPTSGLDARQQEELIGVLDRLVDEGRTLLIATHDPDFSFRCADRIVVLHCGRLLYEGDVEEVFSHSTVLEKASLVKPMLLEVFEKLAGNNPFSPGRIPRDMNEFSRRFQGGT